MPASPLSPTSVRPIVCLGDVMIDIVAKLPGPLALGSDVHAPITYVPGGSAANTAAWLAEVGATVTLVGRVGDDAMGAQAHRDLSERGITDRLTTDPERATGTCIVLVDSDGERTMIPDPGANVALVPDDLDPATFTPDGHLHVSGYALLGGARPAALAAFDRARAVGMTISVDAASAAPLAAAGGEKFASWIGTDLLLFANRAEAEVLTGIADAAQAAQLLSQRFGYAIVKAGADGAYWSDGIHAPTYSPAVKLTKVIDTTGAGDAFAAMFLRSISIGDEPAKALPQATAMAAVACMQTGGRPPSEAIAAAQSVLVEFTQA